nr:MAG TPA: hypothetical protein [Caudoviricetes sp.]
MCYFVRLPQNNEIIYCMYYFVNLLCRNCLPIRELPHKS